MCCPPKTPCECCFTVMASSMLVGVTVLMVGALLYAGAYFLLFIGMFICYFFQKCDTCYHIYVKDGCNHLVHDCIGCCKIMCCPRNNRIADGSYYDSDIENQIELTLRETKIQDIIIIQNPGPMPLSMGRACNKN